MTSTTNPTSPQASSPFFSRLPTELRLRIYADLFSLYNTKFHIDQDRDGSIEPICPCIVSLAHRGDDDNETFDTWRSSNTHSRWGPHQRCSLRFRSEEGHKPGVQAIEALTGSSLPWAFPGVLLVCKRIYMEAKPVLDDVLTIVFTSFNVANTYLAYPERRITNLELCLAFGANLPELYHPDPSQAPRISSKKISRTNNDWEDLCSKLANFSGLRTLRLWAASLDLRPWHQRVDEQALFKSLSNIRQLRRFTLYLPQLPKDEASRGLPGHYLEDDALKDVPYEVVRTERGDPWAAHLARRAEAMRLVNMNLLLEAPPPREAEEVEDDE